MIGKVLLWALIGSCTSVTVITPQTRVWVYSGKTAVLPVLIQFQNPKWEYFHVRWEFLTQNCPVLFYVVNCSTPPPGSQKRTCDHQMEMEGRFSGRVNISRDVSLELRDANPEDAGIYEVTIYALDESGRGQVELVFMEGTTKDLRFMVTKNHSPVGEGGVQTPGLRTSGKSSPSNKGGSLTLERHSIENIIRMLLACLVLGTIGWLLWEHICSLQGNITA
ncbi:uncharacterized protein LOC140703999 [Pogona vitticeps]